MDHPNNARSLFRFATTSKPGGHARRQNWWNFLPMPPPKGDKNCPFFGCPKPPPPPPTSTTRTVPTSTTAATKPTTSAAAPPPVRTTSITTQPAPTSTAPTTTSTSTTSTSTASTQGGSQSNTSTAGTSSTSDSRTTDASTSTTSEHATATASLGDNNVAVTSTTHYLYTSTNIYGVPFGIDKTGGSHVISPTSSPGGNGAGNSGGAGALSATGSPTSRIGAVIGGAVGVLAFVSLTIICLVMAKKRQRRNRIPPSAAFLESMGSGVGAGSFQRLGNNSVVDIRPPSESSNFESRYRDRSDSPRSFLDMREKQFA